MKDDISFIAIAVLLLILQTCNINQNVGSIDDKMDILIEEVKKK